MTFLFSQKIACSQRCHLLLLLLLVWYRQVVRRGPVLPLSQSWRHRSDARQSVPTCRVHGGGKSARLVTRPPSRVVSACSRGPCYRKRRSRAALRRRRRHGAGRRQSVGAMTYPAIVDRRRLKADTTADDMTSSAAGQARPPTSNSTTRSPNSTGGDLLSICSTPCCVTSSKLYSNSKTSTANP